jgi:hypothetical protein
MNPEWVGKNFRRFTQSAPQSGTNTIPTQSVGTRVFACGVVDTGVETLLLARSFILLR